MRTVSVRLLADIGGYTKSMKMAAGETRALSKEIDNAAKGQRLDSLSSAATGFGVGLLAVAGTAAKFAMDYEKQMSAVKAATHASNAEMDALGAAALKAGKDTSFSATQAAKGVEELAKAGVSTADILGGGLSGALDLAAAGGLDVGEAAETAASALTQFKLKGQDVPHVADLLAAAAGKAQGSVHDMGAALNQAGLIASGTGLSIEETTGTLAAFASAGLIGSDAGTSFKTMLQAIQAPSGKTQELMDELGVSAYDTAGNFLGIANFAQNLKDKLSKLTPEMRANAMAQIFGSDATRAATILYEQGASGINEWINKTNDAGYAAETAAIKTDNLAGDIERLKGSIETQAIQSGGGLNKGLRVIAQAAEALVDGLGKLPPVATSSAMVMAAVGGAAVLAAVGFVKARGATAAALTELRDIGPSGERAARGLQSSAKWAGRAAVAFAALQVANAAVSAVQDDLNPQIEALAIGLSNFGRSGDLAGESARLLGSDLGDLETGFKFLADDDNARRSAVKNLQSGIEGLIPGIAGTNTSLTRTKERITAMDEAMAQLVKGGHSAEAKAAFDRLAATLAVNGVSMEEFRKQFPAYAGAVEVAGSASTTAAGGIDDVGTAADDSAKQIEELKKAFDELFNRYMSADEAAINFAETLKATNTELSKGAKTLDINKEAGQQNRRGILDLIKAAEDQRKANLDSGMSIEDADKKYKAQIKTLKNNVINMGYNKTAVNDLINKYLGIPDDVSTDVKQPGMNDSQRKAATYRQKLDDISSHVSTKFTVTNYGDVYGKLTRLLVAQQAARKGISVSAAQSAFNKNAGFAEGGWTGPGGKYTPAGVVHADEFVVKADSRRKIEARAPGLLNEMNATGQIRGYANGGQVWPFPVTAAGTKIMSMADALSKVTPQFSGNWPSSPGAQRGDSGVWHKVIQLIKSGPHSGSFGNSYRPGDPLWHGSGRAVDWMGYNQDPLASFLASKRPLELIHRTRQRDYAYTRGRNKGSFNNALMEAHRNHIHIAMANGGVIREPVFGMGASGATYSFGEGGRPETVTPGIGGAGSSHTTVNLNVSVPPVANPAEVGRVIAGVLEDYLGRGGSVRVRGERVL